MVTIIAPNEKGKEPKLEERHEPIVGEEITEPVVDNLLSWRHSVFSAHGAVRVEERKGAVRLGSSRTRLLQPYGRARSLKHSPPTPVTSKS